MRRFTQYEVTNGELALHSNVVREMESLSVGSKFSVDLEDVRGGGLTIPIYDHGKVTDDGEPIQYFIDREDLVTLCDPN